ncbi:MAG: orotate phosphoribosyltransferase [Gammaproteobacteria bacterium]|nr:MAG: orotate phosphoribosyltransferase [Gammaproteobacteria bacterium]
MKDPAGLLSLLIEQSVLRFGEFTLKSGRKSPYFFNLGAINSGSAIARLGQAYADGAERLGLPFDAVFGPAYKGIPIAVATASALAERGRDCGWVFNRKEAKDHGEGGQFVGAPVTGRLLLVDDVLTAGTAVREAAELIKTAGGTLVGVLIALDRQERVVADEPGTAVSLLEEELAVPVASLLTLQDVIEYLDLKRAADNHPPDILGAIRDYQAAFCDQGNGL